MNVQLLFENKNFEPENIPELFWKDQFADLEADPVLNTMAGKDKTILQVCRQLLADSLCREAEISYRQDILKDCIDQPEHIRKIYALCEDASEDRNRCRYRIDSPHLPSVFSSAVTLLQIDFTALTEILALISKASGNYHSRGLKKLTSMLQNELSDDYLKRVHALLKESGSMDSFLISAKPGNYLQGTSYTLRRLPGFRTKKDWLFAPSYTLAEQDHRGEEDLEFRKDRALLDAADSLVQAAEDLEAFLHQFKTELSFYVGALNLYDALKKNNLPVCFPVPQKDPEWSWINLYDGSLGLLTGEKTVGNTLNTDRKKLILITGANQGGKTTFLRSVGQCQLMAQCGLFVCAAGCKFPIRRRVFTHFKREEDKEMNQGKLEEELARMSSIIDSLQPDDLILFNESFSSTNEREGSELFIQITRALTDRNISVFSVTHLFDYASSFSKNENTLFLRAQRKEDGQRTFLMEQGLPLRTSYGEDIYESVFPTEKECGE